MTEFAHSIHIIKYHTSAVTGFGPPRYGYTSSHDSDCDIVTTRTRNNSHGYFKIFKIDHTVQVRVQ